MKKRHLWWSLVVIGLVARTAGAVQFFVPVPNLGGGFVFRTEFVRQDVSKSKVKFTYIAEGRSGVGLPAQSFTVLPGPSTSTVHPLLTDDYNRDFRRPPDRSDPKFYLSGPGLVLMEGEPGLVGVTTAVEIGGDPTSGWALPMLTHDDGFEPGATAYVLNLMKNSTAATQLSIFNFDPSPAQCSVTVLAPKGWTMDQRIGISVPGVGAVRIADILRNVNAVNASGMSAAVTCDHTFYAMGGFPAASIDDIRVLYPSATPATVGTAEVLVHDGGLRVTRNNSVQTYDLPLVGNVRYRSLVIEFDTKAASPTNDAYYRGLLGMWRLEPGQRFGKTLFFGVNERFDRSKLLIDLGTPYIEVMIKKGNAALVSGRTYHFRIEVNADQKLLRQLVTLPGGGVVADMRSGLFNDDLMARDGHVVTLGFGLPGIGDGAYSPPYGFTFANITVTGYR